MKKTLFASSVLLLTLAGVDRGAAYAQTPALAAGEPHPRRSLSLTISPIHLALPMVELTGEVRVLDRLGVALVAGGGKVTEKRTDGKPALSASAYEGGLQGRYYALGDFRHGMQLGAEAMYLHLSGEVESVSGAASGFAIGPFVGYKYTADIGFTFDGQLGFQRVVASAKATDGTSTAKAEMSTNIVLLNLNVGWSF